MLSFFYHMGSKAELVARETVIVDRRYTKASPMRKNAYLFIKRVFDMIVAIIMLVVTLPITLPVALFIFLTDRGPVFYKQERTGRYGKTFKILKLRSCVRNNEELAQDSYTWIGKIIRKTSIDELPQLINILRGEMSLIGPRPWITDYYKNMNSFERRRYDVLPGITGLAQASGRNDISIFDKIQHDIEYVDHCSIKLDLKILWKTFVSVLVHEGVEGGKGTIEDEIEALQDEQYKSRGVKIVNLFD
jgi:lipopolysaccharide/colanic/teichoic acid biosynthesis glycosyltransferase